MLYMLFDFFWVEINLTAFLLHCALTLNFEAYEGGVSTSKNFKDAG